MPLILLRLVFSKIRSAPLPFFLRPVARGIAGKADAAFSKPELIKQLAFIEKELDRSPLFAGAELTAADVQMSYPLEVSVERQDLSATHPNIVAFVAKVRARAAYIRALERGGPYNLRY